LAGKKGESNEERIEREGNIVIERERGK